MSVLALVFAFLFWPLGIIFGHIARSQIRRTGERGSGLALAGLIVGYLWGALSIFILAAVIFVASHDSGFNNVSTLQDSVSQQVNANLRKSYNNPLYASHASVRSVLCVHHSGTQYSCLVKLSDGINITDSITVSSDGTRWVSNEP